MGSNSRNVVMVTFDSLRADHCGFLSDGSSLTPNLDEMAAEGVVFENAIAPAPRTPTSVPETMTGEPMVHTEASSHADQMARIRTHIESHETLPERLSDLGYTTAGFTANPWTTGTGFEESFDHYESLESDGADSLPSRVGRELFGGTTLGSVIYYFECWRQRRQNFSQWPAHFERIVEGIESLPEPYFAWIFLLDTHNPYIVPPADRVENTTPEMYYAMLRGNAKLRHTTGKSFLDADMPPHVATRLERSYRDAVRSVDRFVGALDSRLDLTDDLFVCHADHGEAFGEHGTYGHQSVLYEENVHVPLLVRDGTVGERGRVTEPVSLRRLPDLALAHGRGEDWRAAVVREDESPISRTESGDSIAVRGERWKFVSHPDGERLYDLDADPDETVNVASDNPAICERLRGRIETYLETVPQQGDEAGSEHSISAEAKSRLEQLGYAE